jgi:hypothetical protein
MLNFLSAKCFLPTPGPWRVNNTIVVWQNCLNQLDVNKQSMAHSDYRTMSPYKRLQYLIRAHCSIVTVSMTTVTYTRYLAKNGSSELVLLFPRPSCRNVPTRATADTFWRRSFLSQLYPILHYWYISRWRKLAQKSLPHRAKCHN